MKQFRKVKKTVTAITFVGVLIACILIAFKVPDRILQTGPWRAELTTASGARIPFIFTVQPGGTALIILNGEEHFKVNDVRLKGDSVIIRMPLFDSEIKGVFSGTVLRGQWIKHLANRDVPMEFTAEPGNSQRFIQAESPFYPVNGRWSAVFTSGPDKDTTVAEFTQVGARVTGTFLTTTGDYRFLEGNVSGDQLCLSCFDGSHAFLFTATVKDDHTIGDGKFYSGFSSVQQWSAKKDAKAALPDAYAITSLKPGFHSISFSFPDLNGRKVSLTDAKFKGKVTIIQFMGSWCPNCMDETAYLVPFYKKYHAKGVEVVGLAYERFTGYDRARKNVLQLKDRFIVPYDLLITGYAADKAEVAKSIPAFSNFTAFPTTLIVNKKGEVTRIHTGFSGPGTGPHYTAFTSEFEKLINDLLAEK